MTDLTEGQAVIYTGPVAAMCGQQYTIDMLVSNNMATLKEKPLMFTRRSNLQPVIADSVPHTGIAHARFSPGELKTCYVDNLTFHDVPKDSNLPSEVNRRVVYTNGNRLDLVGVRGTMVVHDSNNGTHTFVKWDNGERFSTYYKNFSTLAPENDGLMISRSNLPVVEERINEMLSGDGAAHTLHMASGEYWDAAYRAVAIAEFMGKRDSAESLRIAGRRDSLAWRHFGCAYDDIDEARHAELIDMFIEAEKAGA